jgi:hypothetical protein
MKRSPGSYALLQYSPVPDRFEFLNIGVLLVVPGFDFFRVRMAKGQTRIDRLFEHPPRAHLQLLKAGFEKRLSLEYARDRSIVALEAFSSKRANELRLSPILPIAVSEPEETLNQLFDELVGDDEVRPREPRMARKLREAFVAEKVFVDESPPKVSIPEAGIHISAPFGYQNGAYNLIDGIRVTGDQHQALQETGRRALEGGLLWKHFQNERDKKRLLVVGDFSKQPNEFYHAVGNLLEENHVRLYRLDQLGPLIEDIKVNMKLHS